MNINKTITILGVAVCLNMGMTICLRNNLKDYSNSQYKMNKETIDYIDGQLKLNDNIISALSSQNKLNEKIDKKLKSQKIFNLGAFKDITYLYSEVKVLKSKQK